MSEAGLVRKIITSLTKEVGGYWIKVAAGPFQQAGLPDIIGVYKGKFYGLEAKLPGKERNLTKIQEHTLSEIRKAGGIGEMVTSVEMAKTIVLGGKYGETNRTHKTRDRDVSGDIKVSRRLNKPSKKR